MCEIVNGSVFHDLGLRQDCKQSALSQIDENDVKGYAPRMFHDLHLRHMKTLSSIETKEAGPDSRAAHRACIEFNVEASHHHIG